MWSLNPKNQQRLPLFLLFYCVIATASTGIYKWEDDQGVTHYSETPPSGRKAQQVVTPPSPSQETEEEAQERLDRLLQEQEGWKARGTKKKEEQGQQKAVKQHEDERCRRAAQQISVLEQPRPVYRVNEQCEWVLLDDTKRQAEIGRFRTDIRTYCEKEETVILERNFSKNKQELERLRVAFEDEAKQKFCGCAAIRLQEMERPKARTSTAELKNYKREFETKCK